MSAFSGEILPVMCELDYFLMQVFDMIFLDWYLLTESHFYQHYDIDKISSSL